MDYMCWLILGAIVVVLLATVAGCLALVHEGKKYDRWLESLDE